MPEVAIDANALIQYLVQGVTLAVLVWLGTTIYNGNPLSKGAKEHKDNNEVREKVLPELQQEAEEMGETQDEIIERLKAVESEVGDAARHLDSDNERIKTLEEDTKLILKSLLEMLSHSLDGNHVDRMKVVREELEQYLIYR